MQGCESYLEEKPDSSMKIPGTLADLQALLNNEGSVNQNYPSAGDIASDYYYLATADYLSRAEDARSIYVWEGQADAQRTWLFSYSCVLYPNLILDEVDHADAGKMSEEDRRRIKGSALFLRSFLFHQLSVIFAPQYDPAAADRQPGLVLKLTSDVNEVLKRSSMRETYGRIEADLLEAVNLLPASTAYLTQPSRPAAYAALSRLYLSMKDYERAFNYADSCLAMRPSLVDYNNLNASAVTPFSIYNAEVLFHATLSSAESVFSTTWAKADTLLYKSYAPDDLRRSVFYRKNADNSYAFKGSYSGTNTAALFGGLATDEMYLVKAECAARSGDIGLAMTTLNALLKNRMAKQSFRELTASSANEALHLILDHRRKELAFRGGIRWGDLKRLNGEPEFAVTLQRNVDNTLYSLPPDDARYTLLIPYQVIQNNGLEQNPR